MTETPNPQKDYAEDMSGKDIWWAIPLFIFALLGIVYMVTWFVPDETQNEPQAVPCPPEVYIEWKNNLTVPCMFDIGFAMSKETKTLTSERNALNLERAKLMCEKKGGEMRFEEKDYGSWGSGTMWYCVARGKDFAWNGDQFTREEVEVLK